MKRVKLKKKRMGKLKMLKRRKLNPVINKMCINKRKVKLLLCSKRRVKLLVNNKNRSINQKVKTMLITLQLLLKSIEEREKLNRSKYGNQSKSQKSIFKEKRKHQEFNQQLKKRRLQQ